MDKVWVDRLIPAGKGSEIEGLGPQQSRDLFILMRKSRVAMDRALQFLAGGQPYQCQAGKTLMAITPGGNVLPCRRMPMVAGNLWKNTLKEIYQDEIMKSLRETENQDCSGCLYNKMCRGGLRCLAYALTGSPFQPDPACWIAQSLKQRAKGIEPWPSTRALLYYKPWTWRW
ncbi:MAG TPA: SPASM domain-containing protein [Syntrophomonadaceae bacterium]|nr:SPASM domain-containing protein [Syntrophomonadaceae bacterium]